VWKKEDVKTQGVPENPAAALPPVSSSPSTPPRDSSSAPAVSPRAAACISQGIRIKGDVTGSEDLFIDGHLEGKLDLANNSLTVGPNGEIKADIYAREVIVRGRVDGKIIGREKIQLWSTGNVAGDLQTERLTIEDGAVLRGKVEIETGKPVTTREPRGISTPSLKSAAASAASGSVTT
jgi:cytoskeletal protein CcmA (bactofilin family)